MADSAKIKYNNFEFGLTDDFPIPLVSLDREYIKAGERWGISNKITLNGEIIGCTKESLVNSQNKILFGFNEDFKKLEISGLNDLTLAKVISINFDGSDYLSSISYTIELEAYNYAEFLKRQYVLNPVDSISIQEEPDKTITITHTISAKGINSGGYNGLDNAKKFVQSQLNSQKSQGNWPVPNLIDSKDKNYKRLLVSTSESINRISNTYSITNTYKSDLDYENGGILLRYTEDISEQEGQFTIYTFQGSVDGGIGSDLNFDNVRKRFKDFQSSLDTNFVNELIGSLSVSEDLKAGRLTFSVSYSSEKQEVIDDFDISISENSESSIISVSINGTMRAKGPIGTADGTDCKFKLVKDSFKEEKYYNEANKAYKKYLERHDITVPEKVILNKVHLSKSKTENKFEGSISYSYQFDDRISWGYRNLEYTLSFNPSLQAIAADSIVDGSHVFFDLGYRTRARFSVSLNSLGVQDTTENNAISLSQLADEKYAKFCGTEESPIESEIIENDSGSKDQEYNNNHQKTWSFHSKNSIIDTTKSYIKPNQLLI
jgi:hypothetical protein